MKYRELGRTGMMVSELSMGGLFVNSRSISRKNGISTIHRAIELGVNYFDTAPGYGDSEEVMGV